MFVKKSDPFSRERLDNTCNCMYSFQNYPFFSNRRMSVKRAALVIFLLLAVHSFAFANIYVDGYGDLSYQGDAKTQFGGGFALGFDFTGDLKALMRFSYTSVTKDALDKSYYNTTYGVWLPGAKIDNSSTTCLVGVEYLMEVMDRLGWRSSVMLGMNMLKMGYYDKANVTSNYPWITKDDTGVAAALFTGLQYTVSQHVIPFIDLGYHYSYFSGDLSKKTITGYTVMLGIRVPIFSNDALGRGY